MLITFAVSEALVFYSPLNIVNRKMKFILVGAGISNLSLGRLLAENGYRVTLIDRKDHIGGNCFDYFDQNSIDIHVYGTHIFHTDDAEVWRFLSQLSLIHI